MNEWLTVLHRNSPEHWRSSPLVCLVHLCESKVTSNSLFTNFYSFCVFFFPLDHLQWLHIFTAWSAVYFVSASQYLSFLPYQCVSMSGQVCLPVTDGGPPKHTAHLQDNDFPWWLHQVEMLEEMAGKRSKRKRGRKGGQGGGLKEGLGKEGGGEWGGLKEGWGVWRTSWDLAKMLLLFLISCSILRSSRRDEGRKEASDRWSDMRALTNLMDGISKLAKWLHYCGGDRGQQKRQRTFHYWGTIALTELAFCHAVIFELLFAQKCSASSGLMLVFIMTKDMALCPADMSKNRMLNRVFTIKSLQFLTKMSTIFISYQCICFHFFSDIYEVRAAAQIVSQSQKTDKENKLFSLHRAEIPVENGSLSGCVRAKR